MLLLFSLVVSSCSSWSPDFDSITSLNEGQAEDSEADALEGAELNSGDEPATEEEPVIITNPGLSDANIILNAPEILPVETTLICYVDVEDAEQDISCRISWFIDDVLVVTEQVMIGTELPDMRKDFEYSRLMAETAIVRISLEYIPAQGEPQEISAEAVVLIENYDRDHWIELEAPRVLSEVTDRYIGDRTLEWAMENDYDDFDKEVFVNARRYSSRTEYLIWVNLTHQRANIFTGSEGNWELTETFLVATGKPGAGTRRGVTTIKSRSSSGWSFDTFYVKPIVRFWEKTERGTSFAFHSRPYAYSGRLRDERIGFPISKGCIRMYDEDIQYIFDNIPDGTTVVIH